MKLALVRTGGNERVVNVVREDDERVWVRFWINSRGVWDIGPKSGYQINKARLLGPLPDDDKRRHRIEQAKWEIK